MQWDLASYLPSDTLRVTTQARAYYDAKNLLQIRARQGEKTRSSPITLGNFPLFLIFIVTTKKKYGHMKRMSRLYQEQKWVPAKLTRRIAREALPETEIAELH